MKHVCLTILGLGLSTALYASPPAHSNAGGNGGGASHSTENTVVLNGGSVDMEMSGFQQKHLDKTVLNLQTNSGNQKARIKGNDVEAVFEEGAVGDLNNVGVSANALGNVLNVSFAGDGASSLRAGDYTSPGEGLQMGSVSQELGLVSAQMNTGNQTARIRAHGEIDAEIDEGVVGSMSSATISATAVANSVSVNIGGVVK